MRSRFSAVGVRATMVAALLLGACGTSSPPPGGAATGLTGSATVFAAASLTEAFGHIQSSFHAMYPEASVAINFGPSSGLAAQILEQGGADVFASANQAQMTKVSDAGLTAVPIQFARNRLQIIVERGNPQEITGLQDLAAPDLKVILAAPQVPVGDYARRALSKAGVAVEPVSEATDAKGIVGPVVLGEADAGIVYATDVAAAGDRASGIEIPDPLNVSASYQISILDKAAQNEVARRFLDYVIGKEGRRILDSYGFDAGVGG